MAARKAQGRDAVHLDVLKAPVRPADNDQAQASLVRAPRGPAPAPRSSGVALPEPWDELPD